MTDRVEQLVHDEAQPLREIEFNRLRDRCYGLEIFEDKATPIKVLLLDNLFMPHGGRHTHEYFQICYIYKGECEHRIGKHQRYLVKGDAFVVPPGICHTLKAIPGSKVLLFLCDFMPVFLNEHFTSMEESREILDFACIEPFLVSENKVRPRLNLSEEGQVEMERVLFRMAEEDRDKRRGYRLYLKAQLLQLLVLLWREYRDAEYDHKEDAVIRYHLDAINTTIGFLEANYRQDLRLEDACHQAMMSQSYFSKFFKIVTKKTFVEYMHNLRIRKAMELLKNSRLKVIDICHDVGFHNITHFNRVFRARVGMCPSLYRKIAS